MKERGEGGCIRGRVREKGEKYKKHNNIPPMYCWQESYPSNTFYRHLGALLPPIPTI